MVGVKDQNVPGKLCMSGKIDEDLKNSIGALLKESKPDVVCEKDKYDAMWDVCWQNTSITSGHSTFSFAKPYFPKTKLIVKLLDLIAEKGWLLCGCPNFGGVESRDDKGNVTSCVDWPIFVFTKDEQNNSQKFTNQHMMFAVKDSNIPGKLCASGPIGDLEQKMVEKLRTLMKDVESKKDEYDDDHDVVWRNTTITSGHQMMSFKKAYFPNGINMVAILQVCYEAGWRPLGAPNWGGKGDSWPSIVFRKLATTEPAPEVLFGAIKDSNIPGKFCFAGPSAQKVVDAICAKLANVKDNGGVKSEKDSYDDDYDSVARDVHITNGIAAFSFKLPYFPRCDTMVAVLEAITEQGFTVSACPNFGGMLDSWPSFCFEKRDGAKPLAILTVKDDNIPGKVGIAGPGIAEDPTLGQELLEVLKGLCGQDVSQGQDDYDKSATLAYRNTRTTTGHATFTWQKPYWPHGYVVEMVLQIMFKHGYRVVGGPNFGDNGLQWPCILFEKFS